MAHVVRKVNKKAVAGQKRNNDQNKIWMLVGIIGGAVILIIAAILIICGATGVFNSSADDDETVDYFDKYTTTSFDGNAGEEVEFNKATYYEVWNYASAEYADPNTDKQLYIENIFVFAYYSDSFEADLDDEKNNYTILLHKLADFQKLIDDKNLENTAFFVVDASVGTGYNLFTSELFGFSEDDSDGEIVFAYIKDGELTETIDLSGKTDQSIYSTTVSTMLNTVIPNAIGYVKTLS